MSTLRRYARPDSSTLTEKYTTRVSKEVADQFNEWCKKFNLSPSEAIRILIEEELKKLRMESETKSLSLQSIDDYKPSLSFSSSNESRPMPSKVINRPRRSSSSGRFSSNPWKIDNQLPCPICGTWSGATNFKRDHVTPHGYESSEEFFTKHKEECDRMVEERKTGP